MNNVFIFLLIFLFDLVYRIIDRCICAVLIYTVAYMYKKCIIAYNNCNELYATI